MTSTAVDDVTAESSNNPDTGSNDDDCAGNGSSNPQSTAAEPLACVSCRARKLKCDRAPVVCGRCAKLKQDCVYPESRRKPTSKKRNVKELEARLAQVEDMLKENSHKKERSFNKGPTLNGIAPVAGIIPTSDESPLENQTPILNFEFDDIGVVFNDGGAGGSGDNGGEEDYAHNMPDMGNGIPVNSHETPPNFFDLISLGGLAEPLPPQQVMEDLNKDYFQRQHNYIPMIHPGRYLKSFYSAPHMKPPMCLQYAIWSVASNGHEKYHSYHDVFYARARRYAEADELAGHGENFITLGHAMAWALIATDEARSMYFTRASMSSARCTKLCQMMGLHRLDSGPEEMSPTLAPPRDWVELEERRRTFWASFCIDSHGTIATGWPTLHDWEEISTHLPAPEEAFNRGEEARSCTLPDAFAGSSYSTFAGSVVVCHIFNRILRHVYRKRPNDRPEDVEFGGYWKRHRELDNLLSSAFMHLPEAFRLPRNLRNPAAVHTNLNMHASIISLHHAALERIEEHRLPEAVREMSLTRMKTAATEIGSIMKLTSHHNPGYRSPLVALSLYCAASVHIFQAKETFFPSTRTGTCASSTSNSGARPTSAPSASGNSTSQASLQSQTPSSSSYGPTPTPTPTSSTATPQAGPSRPPDMDTTPAFDFSALEFLLSAMEAIGREHVITRAFLRQALFDIERNHLLGPAHAGGMRFPNSEIVQELVGGTDINNSGEAGIGGGSGSGTGGGKSAGRKGTPGNIPLLARSSISRHTPIQPPLPGRLPLNAPIGEKPPAISMLHNGGGFSKHMCPIESLSDPEAPELEIRIPSGAPSTRADVGVQSGTGSGGGIMPERDDQGNNNPAISGGATGTKRRRLHEYSATSTELPDPLLLDPPPLGLSRIEHLFQRAASTSRISPMPFITATNTNPLNNIPGGGHGSSLGNSQRGGPARPLPSQQCSPPNFAAKPPGVQPDPILAGPTPLPFRRAMQPVAGQCTSGRRKGNMGQVQGSGYDNDGAGEEKNALPKLGRDCNPFGIVAPSSVDVDALLSSMGHGGVIVGGGGDSGEVGEDNIGMGQGDDTMGGMGGDTHPPAPAPHQQQQQRRNGMMYANPGMGMGAGNSWDGMENTLGNDFSMPMTGIAGNMAGGGQVGGGGDGMGGGTGAAGQDLSDDPWGILNVPDNDNTWMLGMGGMG